MTNRHSSSEVTESVAQRTEDADDRRFNETLRKMLSTPPKPHKDSQKSSDTGRRTRVSPRKESKE